MVDNQFIIILFLQNKNILCGLIDSLIWTYQPFFIKKSSGMGIIMKFYDDIINVKGIGEKSAELFHKLNINTISDLLFHIPKTFEVFDKPKDIKKCTDQEMVSVLGRLKPNSFQTIKRGKYTITSIVVICENTSLNVKFFHMPYLKKMILPNTSYIFRGLIHIDKFGYHMVHPKVYKTEEYERICGQLQPIYTLTKGITNHAVQKAVNTVIHDLTFPEDFLPETDIKQLELIPLREAIKIIHFPDCVENWINARKRLVFNEFLEFLIQTKQTEKNNYPFDKQLIAVADTNRFIEALPYNLTSSQKKVWNEIEEDLQKNVCMNRLVQGDVGSGKTIIAFLALLFCAANGRQGSLMAPTEVLAKQHFDSLSEFTQKFHLCFKPILLVGSMSLKDKKKARSGIEDGTYNVIIGTQALIQSGVNYHDLALVITDEQHRFGVKQRESFVNKGGQAHVLVMSATPIPRTLAMILYSNLSISVINEMPVGRLPIKNCIIEPKLRNKSYQFICDEIKKGHQAYIVCPMVESNDDEGLENVLDYTEKLKEVFPKEVIIAFLHGKMAPKEKNEIMERFESREIDILVSTTVIEVGINVPNATVMMIENSERFGLAQLHQLRGRVGRGIDQSYCIFLTGNSSSKTMERLKILLESNDGFYIADKDLSLRGPGDLFGIRQSGELGFVIGDIYQDSSILIMASQYLDDIYSKNGIFLSDILSKIDCFKINSVDFRTI